MHRCPAPIRFALLLLVTLCVSLPAPATSAEGGPERLYLPLVLRPQAPDPELRLVATSDAFISELNPDQNLGSDTYLYAGNEEEVFGKPGILRALIGFTLPAVGSFPVAQATLRIYYAGYFDITGKSRVITVQAADVSWDESTVTWANQPAAGDVYGSVNIVADERWGYRDLDVTTLVQRWFEGSLANNGFYLIGPEVSGSDASYRIFLSRESTSTTDPYPPELIVKF